LTQLKIPPLARVLLLATVSARTVHLVIATAAALNLAMVPARTAHLVIATVTVLVKQIKVEMGISRNLKLAGYTNN
jgi:hypothetical protein